MTAAIRRRATFMAIASFMAFAVLAPLGAMTMHHAGAQSSCGEFSFSFAGTRLINDGISPSAGPFPIELPAGTYDILLESHDNHPDGEYQTEQTGEQFYFTLDNGFVSRVSDDIPANGETMSTLFERVPIERATSISVHHRGVGGVNSVNVVCIGFTTRVLDTPALFQEPPTTTTVAPVVPPPSPQPTPPPQLALTGPPLTGALATAGIGMIVLGLAALEIFRRRSTRRS